MSSATPAPAPRYPVRWGDTQAGKNEHWVKEKHHQTLMGRGGQVVKQQEKRV